MLITNFNNLLLHILLFLFQITLRIYGIFYSISMLKASTWDWRRELFFTLFFYWDIIDILKYKYGRQIYIWLCLICGREHSVCTQSVFSINPRNTQTLPARHNCSGSRQDLPCTVPLLNTPPQSPKHRGAERTHSLPARGGKQVAWGQPYLPSLPKFNYQWSHFTSREEWTHKHKEFGSCAHSAVFVRRKFLEWRSVFLLSTQKMGKGKFSLKLITIISISLQIS